MGTGYGADYAKHHEIEKYRDRGTEDREGEMQTERVFSDGYASTGRQAERRRSFRAMAESERLQRR